ncbi:MAG: hypothetical protein ABIW76_00435 [Fibrobacteria bacterium]
MTAFGLLVPSELRAAIITLVLLLQVTVLSAKSPEDFVGPAAPAPAPAKSAASIKPAAAPKGSSNSAMDTAALHAIYLEGDFDKAIRVMEGALKNEKNAISHSDSVFIFKHLGVMYAATPATREKGRYYMGQLIYIEPTAKILDMYASDMIYLIFRNVQEEFAAKYPNVATPAPVAVDTLPKTAGPPPDIKPTPVAHGRGRSGKTVYWVAGGAVAVGAVVLLFVLLDSPEPKTRTIVLTE